MNKILTFFLLLISCSWMARAAEPQIVKAVGIIDGKPLYSITITHLTEGEIEKTHVQAADLSSRAIYEQSLLYEKGALKEYTIHRFDDGSTAKATASGGRVNYQTTVLGKTSSGDESLPDAWVVGPALSQWVETHFGEFAQGKELSIHIGVPSKADSFTFDARQVDGDEPEVKDHRWLKIKLSPRSIFIKALVKSILYYVDAKSGALRRYEGPTEFRNPGSDKGLNGVIQYGP